MILHQPHLMPYINLGYLRAIFHFATATGVPLQPLLDIFGITPAKLDDDDYQVSVEHLDHVFCLLESLTGNAHVGMHSALHMSPSDLGVLGMLLMTCRQPSELFELHTRYGKLISNATWPEYSQQGDQLCMTLHDSDPRHKLTRHRTEYSLTGWLRLARWILGETFSPVMLDVTFPAPEDCTELQRMFACPIEFESANTRLYFAIHAPVSMSASADSRLRKMLEVEAHQHVQRLRGMQSEIDAELVAIKHFIAEQLALGVPELARVAAHFGDAPRSFQRKLEARATRFTELVEQVRIELAQRWISDTQISLAELAMLLGFSDQSTFQRAFKRWFALTPGDYRRQQLQQQQRLKETTSIQV